MSSERGLSDVACLQHLISPIIEGPFTPWLETGIFLFPASIGKGALGFCALQPGCLRVKAVALLLEDRLAGACMPLQCGWCKGASTPRTFLWSCEWPLASLHCNRLHDEIHFGSVGVTAACTELIADISAMAEGDGKSLR